MAFVIAQWQTAYVSVAAQVLLKRRQKIVDPQIGSSNPFAFWFALYPPCAGAIDYRHVDWRTNDSCCCCTILRRELRQHRLALAF